MSGHRALGVGDPPFAGELSVPVRARSILLSTHQVQVEELTTAALRSPHAAPPKLSPGAADYGFVGVDAVPYLVSWGTQDVRPGPLLAVVTDVEQRLGALHLTGELGEWTSPSADLRVAEVLEQHRECMVDSAHDLMEVLHLRVAPLRVHRIWTGPPGTAAPLAVDPAGFEAAEPNSWAAFGQGVVRHLNEQHQDHLLELVRGSGASAATAVSLTRLDSGGAILTAMGLDGVMDIVMPFDPPAVTPGEACHRLTSIH